MNDYFSTVNSLPFYLIVGAVLLFISIMCVVFIIKSYRAGIAMGMDKTALKRAITSSATFTVLPSVSILLGVIALSGSLGVPFSWLRLSVVGALQYELNVAEIAATSYGLSGLKVTEMTMEAFTTTGLVMTVGILGGVLLCIFLLKKYLNKVNSKPKKETSGSAKPGFGAYATIAMFVGLCSAYIGSYIGSWAHGDWMPIFVAGVSALFMAIFEYFTQKKGLSWLDNFSLAGSMLAAMAAAVLINLI